MYKVFVFTWGMDELSGFFTSYMCINYLFCHITLIEYFGYAKQQLILLYATDHSYSIQIKLMMYAAGYFESMIFIFYEKLSYIDK